MQDGPIDCDIHPAVPGIAALTPFMEPYWREQVTVRGIDGLDLVELPRRRARRRPGRLAGRRDRSPAPTSPRCAATRSTGSAAGSPSATCSTARPPCSTATSPTALARATNDWLAAEWLDREPRLRGSITVAPQDPDGAAAEIERRAADGRFVQVLLLAVGRRPARPARSTGRSTPPPSATACRSACTPAAPTATPPPAMAGPPTTSRTSSLRSHAFQGAAAQPACMRACSHKFPALRFVMIEAGFTWLPNFLWRANRTWRGVRAEVPWVDRPPGRADPRARPLHPAARRRPARRRQHGARAGPDRQRRHAAVLDRLAALAVRRRRPVPARLLRRSAAAG